MRKFKNMIKKTFNFFGLQIIRQETQGLTFGNLKFLNIKKNDVIFDLGCHVGSTIEEINKIWPQAKVYGFEPFKDFANKCHKRFLKNSQIEIYQIAISDRKGYSNLTTSNYALSLHGNNLSTNYEGNCKTKVRTIKLDNFVDEKKINNIKLIKIDVEGHELAVLKGMKNLLSKQKVDVIVCEVMFIEHFKGQALFLELSKFLEKFGYIIFDIRQLKRTSNKQLRFGNCVYISSRIFRKL